VELCRRIQEATEGCRLAILCATAVEAGPIIAAMTSTRTLSVASKELVVGDLPAAVGVSVPTLRAVLAITGCDKTNAAHAVTSILQAMEPAPALVLQVGIAGALPAVGSEGGARPGDLVVATREIYADTGSSSPGGWLSADDLGLPIAVVDGRECGNTFALNESLTAAATVILTAATGGPDGSEMLHGRRVIAGPFVTVSRVSGVRAEGEELARRWGAVAESMEGAAAAHICALYAVPFLEIRGVSNMVVDRERASWRVEEAVGAACDAALVLCRVFDSLPLPALIEGGRG
jgi:futalosine hydrolase